jgi:hypothetical protein
MEEEGGREGGVTSMAREWGMLMMVSPFLKGLRAMMPRML